MMNKEGLRKYLSKMINEYMERKNIAPEKLQKETGLSIHIIQGYMDSTKEIKIPELQKICVALGANLLSWLEPKSPNPTMEYRGGRSDGRINKVEDTLCFITELYQEKPNNQFNTNIKSNEYVLVLSEIQSIIRKIRSEEIYSTVDLYRAIKIPIVMIPMESDSDFDACLFKNNGKCLVCINKTLFTKRNTKRITFSLLHEAGHFIFNHNGIIEAMPTGNFNLKNLYSGSISSDKIEELIANKFAQYFLISWDEALELSKELKAPCLSEEMLSSISKKGASLQVCANSILDVEKQHGFNRVTMDYNEIFEALGNGFDRHVDSNVIEDFLITNHTCLINLLKKNKDMYSNCIFNKICKDLGISSKEVSGIEHSKNIQCSNFNSGANSI